MDPLFSSHTHKNTDLSLLARSARSFSTTMSSIPLKAEKQQHLLQVKFNTVQEWDTMLAVKDHLFSFLNSIYASTPQPPVTPPTPPTTPPTPTPFDLALEKAKAAKTSLETATTAEEFATAWQTFQAAIAEMETTATTTDQATLSAWKTAIAAQQDTIDKISKLDEIYNSFIQYSSFLDTTTDLEKVAFSRGFAMLATDEMDKVIEALTNANVSYPVIQDLQTKITAQSQALTKKGEAIQTAYELGKECIAAVKGAEMNNSAQNINAVTKQIAASKQQVDSYNTTYPNVTIIQTAKSEILQAEADLQNISSSGSGTSTPEGAPGGASTVGSSQDTGSTLSDKRVVSLLDNVDNETLNIMLQGFRDMIGQFYDQNAVNRQELGNFNNYKEILKDAEDASEAVLEDMFANEGTLSEERSSLTLEDALSVISSASVNMGGGGTSAPSTQVGENVKQLYKASTSKRKDRLASGYQAWSKLYTMSIGSDEQVRSALGEIIDPALSEPVFYAGSNARKDDGLRAAHFVARHSRTVGDVYRNVRALERGLQFMQSHPGASVSQTVQYLKDSAQLPRLGLLAGSASAGKFIKNLEKVFEEESLRLSKEKAARFEIKPSYIQQVLVNIASLFAGYLQ